MLNFIRRWFLQAKIRKLADGHQFQGQPLSKWILDLLEKADSIEFAMENSDRIALRLAKSATPSPKEPFRCGGYVLESISVWIRRGQYMDFTPALNYFRALRAERDEMVKSLQPVTTLIIPVLLQVIDRGSPYERLSVVRLLPDFATAGGTAVSNKLHELAIDPNETKIIRDAAQKALERSTERINDGKGTPSQTGTP